MIDGDTAIALLTLLAALGAQLVIAWPRRGRLMLVRVEGAGRHRAGNRRVIALSVALAAAAAAAFLADPGQGWRPLQIAAWLAALAVPPAWMLVELSRALAGARPATVPSRYRVWLERPPGLLHYLSPPLQLLNAAALIAPPAILCAVYDQPAAPWLALFLPLMIYLTALVLACAWMQARERWALPDEDQERYVELHREKRLRSVRLLEVALLSWNLGAALIWISAAAGARGPGYLGAGIGVAIGGLGAVAALATQLPRLTRLADQLTAMAGTEALGTRPDGWRLRGLVYCAASDPAVFVPRRRGVGQTLNLGRPAAWLFVAAVFLAPPAMILAALARL